MTPLPPTLAAITTTAARLAPFVRHTPVWEWHDEVVSATLKLELFQHSGSFKVRAAINHILALTPAQHGQGVTAVSAGNHAVAVAYAAQRLGTSAKVVMPSTASPARVRLCHRFGAEVVLVADIATAFDTALQMQRTEHRYLIHPFDDPLTAAATATLGLEFLRQVADLEAVVIPIGGGGLIGGMAAAIKQARPGCLVYGVEPRDNDVLKRSVASGRPEKATATRSIADSLSPPFALPYTLSLVQRFVDDIVLVTDDELTAGMYLLFARAKLAVEPAGAATTAGAIGPLRGRLQGKRTGLLICGANIDAPEFAAYLERGTRALAP